ncbi:MAG: CotH kinase family protein [Chitinispirillia bacterium]|nr:CotH kinase family protein [Chitinispirillia bacterium]
MTSRNLIFASVFISIAAAASFGQTLTFSPAPGSYASNFNLSINGGSDAEIWYTTNGSEPRPNASGSTRYSAAISIADRTDSPNNFSNIRTTPPTNMLNVMGGDLPWLSPNGNVTKGTVIRAAAFRNNTVVPGSMISGSFFVLPQGSPYRSLPIVSVIVDSLDFFGHSQGIYVPGANYDSTNSSTSSRSWTGNYYMRGDDWERPGHFEYFGTNGNLVVSQAVGYRINGGWTRRFPQKSLRVYARREYSERHINFNDRLFHNRPDSSFRRLLIRTGGNDVQVALIRDASAQYMLSHVKTFDIQAFRSVIVFVNGEFWGWHNIRERHDKHFLERVYGVDPDNVDILNFSSSGRGTGAMRAAVGEGDSAAFFRMAEYSRNVRNNPADKAVLDSMLKLIDIDSYVDHYAVQILLGNWDGVWNNQRLWRERRNFSWYAPKGRDGRFRWFVHDLDQIMNIWAGVHDNAHTDPAAPTLSMIFQSNPGNELFRNLMANESVRHHFINSFANLLNTAFHPGRSDSVIDSIVTTMKPIMNDHIRRWRNPVFHREQGREHLTDDANPSRSWEEISIPKLKSNYNRKIEGFRDAVRNSSNFRPSGHDNLGTDRTVTFISDTTRGLIKINSMVIDPRMPSTNSQRSWNGSRFSWGGDYFARAPITVSGAGKRFHRIDKWIVREMRDGSEITTESTDSILTVRLSSEAPGTGPTCSQQCRIEAVFVYDSLYFVEPVGIADRKVSRNASGISISHHVRSRSNVVFNFTLPEAGNAELRVYNLAGKEVGRVSNGRFGPGTHQLNWNTGKAGSGVYIYRLKVNNRMLDGRLRI